MTFATPFRKRLAKSRSYWSNPDKRLASVNGKRAARGLPLASSVEEIHTPVSRGKMIASGRQRNERGWFV